jgi:hypothetical protein
MLFRRDLTKPSRRLHAEVLPDDRVWTQLLRVGAIECTGNVVLPVLCGSSDEFHLPIRFQATRKTPLLNRTRDQGIE